MYNPSILNQYSAVKIRCVTKVRMQAQATEVYPCFLWSSHEDLLSPTENLLLRKMKVRPDEQSHGLGIQKSYCKRKMAFRRLWAKKPRHSQNIVAKIWYTIPGIPLSHHASTGVFNAEDKPQKHKLVW